MQQTEKDLLLDIVRVLTTLAQAGAPEMRQGLHPIIGVVEFITQAVEREEPWLLGSRLLTGRWQLLAEFFEVLCADSGRAEFFMEEARRIVRDRGMLPACEELLRSIRGQAARPVRRAATHPADWPTGPTPPKKGG